VGAEAALVTAGCADFEIAEVETEEELWSAITDRTAMLFFLDRADGQGRIRRQALAAWLLQPGEYEVVARR
jgi:hypothetical protein